MIMTGNCLAQFLLALIGIGISVRVVAVPTPEIAIPRERTGFLLLGTTKKEVQIGVNGTTSANSKDYRYWISSNSAEYEAARRDCKANGDHLLQIETLEELEEVEEFLQDTDQTVTRVWVGGRYQVERETFIWENGLPIDDQLWGQGQPSESNANSRVAADTAGQIALLRSQANTVVTRYICEGI